MISMLKSRLGAAMESARRRLRKTSVPGGKKAVGKEHEQFSEVEEVGEFQYIRRIKYVSGDPETNRGGKSVNPTCHVGFYLHRSDDLLESFQQGECGGGGRSWSEWGAVRGRGRGTQPVQGRVRGMRGACAGAPMVVEEQRM